MKRKVLSLSSIGVVRNTVKNPKQRGWASVASDLVLEERYAEALDGVEDYSHVMVIFWLDQAKAPKSMKEHVQGRKELPVVGIFARRAPIRPNPIAVTSVPLVSRNGNILRVKGLDAIDGTPLLDIKPYTPAFDQVDGAHVPGWSRLIYEDEDYF